MWWRNESDDNRFGDGAVDDNPIEVLDNLTDKLLLGLYLVLAGAAILGADYLWPRSSPASFKTASAIFLKYFWCLGYLPGHYHRGVQLNFPQSLLLWGLLIEICGAFIFIRRAVWRFEDHRPANIVQLNLEEPTGVNEAGAKQTPSSR